MQQPPYKVHLSHITEAYENSPNLLSFERELQKIFQEMDKEEAITIALAIYEEHTNTGIGHIPATIIFSSEGATPQIVWEKLLKVLHTPNKIKPNTNRKIVKVTEEINTLFGKFHFYDEWGEAVATNHMLRVAGGNPTEIARVYKDTAREYSQYATEWYENLRWQFDGYLLPTDANSKEEKELFTILQQTLALSKEQEAQGKRQNTNEDTASYIVRSLEEALTLFNENEMHSDIEWLQKASNLLDLQFIDYREKVYKLRGIPYKK